MARITVEDCILKVPNRFELVLVAAQRARDISAGGVLTVERDNDKNPVVSLREIAEETVATDPLRQAVIQGLQRHVEQDEPADEDIDVASLSSGLGAATREDALAGGALIDEEIAGEVLTVGGEAIEEGADIAEGGEAAEAETDAEPEDEPRAG